jgi:hypothetical protein
MLRDAQGSSYSKLKYLPSVDIYPICHNGEPVPINNSAQILKWDGTIATGFSSTASGTEDDPIIIYTPPEFRYLAKGANGDTDGKYYKMADNILAIDFGAFDDIELEEDGPANWESWQERITNHKTELTDKYSSYVPTYSSTDAFAGHFDGNGVVFYNIYCKAKYAGLFPSVRSSTKAQEGFTIGNLTIKNSCFINSGTEHNYGAGAIFGAHTNFWEGSTVDTALEPINNIHDCNIINV